MSRDFFISFTGRDKHWADWIAWQLDNAGYSTMYQGWHFRPGHNFIEKMQEGTMECSRTLAVITEAYFQAPNSAAEWYAALRRDPDGKLGLLLPVRVEKCEVPGLLGPIIYIDLVNLDEEAARTQLLRGLDQSSAKPSAAPPFPGSMPKPEFPGPSSESHPVAPLHSTAITPPVMRSRTDSATDTSEIAPRLHGLLKAPLHSYHLTLDSAGQPIWSYAILAFKQCKQSDTLKACAVHLPDNGTSAAQRLRHEYEYEASFDRNHLVLRAHSPDKTDDDIFVRIFPSAARYTFPLCGVGFIAHTWNHNPASTISILAEEQLECASSLASGESTSDPLITQTLQAEWDKAAQRLRLARLPRGVTMYPNWDKFPALLDTIERNKKDEVDLRIVTIAFTDLGWPEGKLMALAKRGLRIKFF